MNRYLKTLRVFWVTATAAEMEYRTNFAIAVLSSLGGVGGSVFVLWIMFFGGDPSQAAQAGEAAAGAVAASGAASGVSINGWSWEQALIVMGLFTLLEGVAESLFTPNLNRIVQQVQMGTLDFVLLKPIDSQFWLSTRNVSLWGIPNFLLGIGLLGFAAVRLELSPGDIAMGLFPLALGLAMMYSLWFMLGATSIWFVKIYNVTEVLRAIIEAGKYPVAAYPAGFRFVFTFVVPVAFMTSVPAEIMLGKAAGAALLIAMALAVALFIASRLWWRFALRHYTSASS